MFTIQKISKHYPRIIWFQRSDIPNISAIVRRVNNRYQWVIIKQYDQYSKPIELSVGYSPNVLYAMKRVFKSFKGIN